MKPGACRQGGQAVAKGQRLQPTRGVAVVAPPPRGRLAQPIPASALNSPEAETARAQTADRRALHARSQTACLVPSRPLLIPGVMGLPATGRSGSRSVARRTLPGARCGLTYSHNACV